MIRTQPVRPSVAARRLARQLVLPVALLALGSTAAAQATGTTGCAAIQGSTGPQRVNGVNYIVNTTSSQFSELQFLSHPEPGDPAGTPRGTYSSEQIDAELAELASHGIGRVRVFGSFWGWLSARDDYEQNLADFATLCGNHGIEIMFTPWSTTNDLTGYANFQLNELLADAGDPDEPGELGFESALFDLMTIDARVTYMSVFGMGLVGPTCLILFHDEPWQMGWRSEPGNGYFHALATTGTADDWASWYAGEMLTYVRESALAIGGAATTRVVWDLMNEPEAIFNPQTLPAGVDLEVLNDEVRSFLHDSFDEVEAAYAVLGKSTEYTVGYARPDHLSDDLIFLHTGSTTFRIDVVTYHSYAAIRDFRTDINTAKQAAVDLAQEVGGLVPPVWCTEFYAPNFPLEVIEADPGTLHLYFDALEDNCVDGMVWGALASNVLFREDGFGPCGGAPGVGGWYPDGFLIPRLVDANDDWVSPLDDMWNSALDIEFRLPDDTPENILDAQAFLAW